MKILGLIKYAIFLSLFAAILMCFWTYTYSTTSIDQANVIVYPYRSSTVVVAIVASLLFLLYFYLGIHSKESSAICVKISNL